LETLHVVDDLLAGFRGYYRRIGRADSLIVRMVLHGMAVTRLAAGRLVMMVQRGLMADYQRGGVAPTTDVEFNYSKWRGYLSELAHAEMLDWFRAILRSTISTRATM
jgi:hypothetical protein